MVIIFTSTLFSLYHVVGAIRLGISNAKMGYVGPARALEVIAFKKGVDIDECVMIIANAHLPASIPVRGLSASHTAIVHLPSGRRVVVEMGENEYKTLIFRCEIDDLPQLSIS